MMDAVGVWGYFVGMGGGSEGSPGLSSPVAKEPVAASQRTNGASVLKLHSLLSYVDPGLPPLTLRGLALALLPVL